MMTRANGNRKHIAFFGKRNAGKSTLFNLLLEEDYSLVSKYQGTTTDPVYKATEILGCGPVRLVDTAGWDDEGDLGRLRVERTQEVLEKVDMAIYVADAREGLSKEEEEKAKLAFRRFHIPWALVWNHVDEISGERLATYKKAYPEALFLEGEAEGKKKALQSLLEEMLEEEEEDPPLVGDLLPYGASLVLVIPIDSEAPKGRLILPQVQLLRDALDHGIHCHVVRDTEVLEELERLGKVDLIVTDSQIFGRLSKMLPEDLPLTSFSILFARQKGELQEFIKGIEALKALEGKKAKVLIAESCSHTRSHEDIGTVKIPALLRKKVSKDLEFSFQHGTKLDQDLEDFELIIHCGSCMLTRKMMLNRLQKAKEAGVEMTNYGIVLAYVNGILDRAVKTILEKKEKRR